MMPPLVAVKCVPSCKSVDTSELKRLDRLLNVEGIKHTFAERPEVGGAQIVIPGDAPFEDGYSISVIQNRLSYGGERGLVECWVKLSANSRNDPVGFLTIEEAMGIIKDALPKLRRKRKK